MSAKLVVFWTRCSFGRDMTTAVVTASDVVQRCNNVIGETLAEKNSNVGFDYQQEYAGCCQFRKAPLSKHSIKKREAHKER